MALGGVFGVFGGFSLIKQFFLLNLVRGLDGVARAMAIEISNCLLLAFGGSRICAACSI